jgi:hypothetical protein
MFLYNKTTEIKPGKGWRDANGVLHPRNWHIWSDDHKASMNIEEITLDAKPDGKFHNWIDKGLEGISNITDKKLDDTGSGDNLVLGLKSKEKLNVKSQQGSLLSQTDWAVIRKADTGTAIPSKIATYRAAIRTKATEMEKAIDDASDMAAFKALFLTHKTDSDGKVTKTGILFDWPELEE